VGDTAVPKRMRALAGAFYGRLEAYAGAIAEPSALEAALARNVWGAGTHPFAARLAGYAAAVAAQQASAPIAAMFEPDNWPGP
jgi:cytochrome b pre-mRNA-processing protein 3